jgi:hypothetical protein
MVHDDMTWIQVQRKEKDCKESADKVVMMNRGSKGKRVLVPRACPQQSYKDCRFLPERRICTSEFK